MSKFRKRNKTSTLLVYLVPKTRIRNFDAMVTQNQQRSVKKKCDARAKLLFLLVKPCVFYVLDAVALLALKFPVPVKICVLVFPRYFLVGYSSRLILESYS